MRVALLKSRLSSIGGLEKSTRGLIAAFEQRGCQVNCLTTESDYGVCVCSRSKITLYHYLKFDRACQRFLAQNPHEIVFGMERNLGATHYRAGMGVHAVYLERRAQLEGSVKLRLNPLNSFILKRERQIFEDPRLRRLFTNSHMVKNEIVQRFNVCPEKIIVVHNGVDFDGLAKPFLERKKPKRFTFLFVGNGFKRKGLDFLLPALPKEAQLIVVGKDKNMQRYKKMASSNVTFLGLTSSLLPLMQNADALIIPSLYDPFANVTVEALAMGLYVVSSRFNGGHEVIQKNCGTLIDDLYSEQSMRSALQRAMENTTAAAAIRDSVKELKSSLQFSKIVESSLC